MMFRASLTSLKNIALKYDSSKISQVSFFLKICNFLSNPNSPAAYFRVNPNDNYFLGKSGVLKISKHVFYDIDLFIESENIQKLSEITIYILHSLKKINKS